MMSHRMPVILTILLFALAGCATNGTLVVLAPDADGRTGAATVSNAGGSARLDAPYFATTASNGNRAPTLPAAMDKGAVETLFADALSIQPKQPRHFILYFEKDTTLTAESAALIPEILASIKERNSADIAVVGHTDSVGSREYNLNLSRNRASAIRDVLVGKGVDAGHISTTSHGKDNPLVKTADNVMEPRNRRVEVVVR